MEDDEGVAGGEDLEAALGHVAHYEGYDAGSDQSLSADGQMFPAGGDGVVAGNGESSARKALVVCKAYVRSGTCDEYLFPFAVSLVSLPLPASF